MAKSLNVTELDFDLIKQNLKAYLQNQSVFTDYDFEGSGLSVLLDILAYNTHYNAFYANMAINEMFIDSAVKRESVVSLAKMLNYIPRSVRSAQATIDLTVNGVTGSPTSLTISRYTAFTSQINGTNYNFYNIEPTIITPNGSVYSYQGLQVYEGTYVSNKFTVSNPGPDEKYQIPNKNVDTTTIRVTVQDTASSSTSTTYTEFGGDITQVAGDSTIYYLQQNTKGYYEIYFGDGILGNKLTAGNRITVEYLVSSGTAANVSDKVSQSMSIVGTISGYSNVTVTVTSKATTGQDAETIDEIRFNAPKAATSQNRLVTKTDYSAYLKRNYNYIDDVTVWGGEENIPPAYGKVFVSVIPKTSQYLTTSRKTAILEDFKSHRAMAIMPAFVDPDIFYANVSSVIKYNPNATNDSSTDIQTAAINAISTYFSDNLRAFGDYFSQSKLQSAIDNSKASILSNLTSVYFEKRITPTTGVAFSNKIKLDNKYTQHSLSSTKFYYQLNDQIYPARIKDVPDAATVNLTGTYRRSGAIITATFTTAHNLTVGETVTLGFTGSSVGGSYTIDTVLSDYIFTVISEATGNDSGTITVESEARGSIVVYDATNNNVLNSNVGFVSYDSGIIQITNLNIFGFTGDQSDFRIYFALTEDSQDISTVRNQIIRLSTETASSESNRLAGTSVSTIAIPK